VFLANYPIAAVILPRVLRFETAGSTNQGTGRYGQSALQVFDLDSGELLQQKALPENLFGEGITVLEDRIVQLTWRAGRGLVYRRDTLEQIDSFSIPGEGWGLTNDGQRLIYSDGGSRLHFVSLENWEIAGGVDVRLSGKPLRLLNELEWTPFFLLANVWGQDWIVMINPTTGDVVGRLDLRGLLPREERRAGTDVLNGVAWDPATKHLWVTGKNWPWIYQIELYRAAEKALE
jgi:glutamine cyclotransferase